MARQVHTYTTKDSKGKDVEVKVTRHRTGPETYVYSAKTHTFRVGSYKKMDDKKYRLTATKASYMGQIGHHGEVFLADRQTPKEATQALVDYFYPQWDYMQSAPVLRSQGHALRSNRDFTITQNEESGRWRLICQIPGAPVNPIYGQSIVAESDDKAILEAFLNTRTRDGQYLDASWFHLQIEMYASKGPCGKEVNVGFEMVDGLTRREVLSGDQGRQLMGMLRSHPEQTLRCLQWVYLKFAQRLLDRIPGQLKKAIKTVAPIFTESITRFQGVLDARKATLQDPTPENFETFRNLAKDFNHLGQYTMESGWAAQNRVKDFPSLLEAYEQKEAIRGLAIHCQHLVDALYFVMPAVGWFHELHVNGGSVAKERAETLATMFDLIPGGGERLGEALYEGNI